MKVSDALIAIQSNSMHLRFTENSKMEYFIKLPPIETVVDEGGQLLRVSGKLKKMKEWNENINNYQRNK